MNREAIWEGAVRTAGAVSRRKGKGKDLSLISRMYNTDQNSGMGLGHLVCYLPTMCISITKKSRQAHPFTHWEHLQHARQCTRNGKQRWPMWQNKYWPDGQSCPWQWFWEAVGFLRSSPREQQGSVVCLKAGAFSPVQCLSSQYQLRARMWLVTF